jgi:hypothetical protein
MRQYASYLPILSSQLFVTSNYWHALLHYSLSYRDPAESAPARTSAPFCHLDTIHHEPSVKLPQNSVSSFWRRIDSVLWQGRAQPFETTTNNSISMLM